MIRRMLRPQWSGWSADTSASSPSVDAIKFLTTVASSCWCVPESFPRSFSVSMVVLGLGMGCGQPTIISLVSRAGRRGEQGRVQGAASAVESLSRTMGPVWGTFSMQRYGDSAPYFSAAAFALLTLSLSVGYQVAGSDAAPPPPLS